MLKTFARNIKPIWERINKALPRTQKLSASVATDKHLLERTGMPLEYIYRDMGRMLGDELVKKFNKDICINIDEDYMRSQLIHSVELYVFTPEELERFAKDIGGSGITEDDLCVARTEGYEKGKKDALAAISNLNKVAVDAAGRDVCDECPDF